MNIRQSALNRSGLLLGLTTAAVMGFAGYRVGGSMTSPMTCGVNEPGSYLLTYTNCASAHNVNILSTQTFADMTAAAEATFLADCRAELAGLDADDRGQGVIERITYPLVNGGTRQVCFVRV
jgi:hypothetical protein